MLHFQAFVCWMVCTSFSHHDFHCSCLYFGPFRRYYHLFMYTLYFAMKQPNKTKKLTAQVTLNDVVQLLDLNTERNSTCMTSLSC